MGRKVLWKREIKGEIGISFLTITTNITKSRAIKLKDVHISQIQRQKKNVICRTAFSFSRKMKYKLAIKVKTALQRSLQVSWIMSAKTTQRNATQHNTTQHKFIRNVASLSQRGSHPQGPHLYGFLVVIRNLFASDCLF